MPVVHGLGSTFRRSGRSSRVRHRKSAICKAKLTPTVVQGEMCSLYKINLTPFPSRSFQTKLPFGLKRIFFITQVRVVRIH